MLPEKDIVISASVSCFDLYNIESQLIKIEEAGIELLHYDVIDGRFNDCFILGTPTLKAIREHTRLPIEVHLGTYEPEKYIRQFVESGADYIAVHYEVFDNINEIIRIFDLIRFSGAKPLLALKAETDVNHEIVALSSKVEWIIKLTVDPGYSGQKIKSEAVDKIIALNRAIREKNIKTRIEADGNININTIPSVVNAGATILTGGTSGLFKKEKSIYDNAQDMFSTAMLNRAIL